MRFYLALYLAKITNFISSLLNIGAGYTWPGHLALMIYPNLLSSSKMHFNKGIILVTGTNGKTTTCKMITHVLKENNFNVLSNSSGANLQNGIVSSILLNMNLFGKTKAEIAVLEVDEMNLQYILEHLKVSVILLLNLSRDQLDRFGETDYILENWNSALGSISYDCSLILDSTEDKFKTIPKFFKNNIDYFDDNKDVLENTTLKGTFNAKNANAALITLAKIGVNPKATYKAFMNFEPAYGRGEIIKNKISCFQILLAKNPSSFNNNLKYIIEEKPDFECVLLVLNDNIPDGRDISWIYDINPQLLHNALKNKKICVTGTRYLEMVVRLNYAHLPIDMEFISNDTKQILDKIENTQIKNILVLPNYSAMLRIREILLGRKIL